MQDKSHELAEKIGYKFRDMELLLTALRHTSYANEKHMPKYYSNERLEFLGDAVLELISSEFLFFSDRKMPEGELTRLRASLVCEPSLAACARDIGLGNYILLGKGEDESGGRLRDSITSDALEALIGAIYLDGGYENARKFILKFILKDLDEKRLFHDSKTILQEMVQGNKMGVPSYHLLKEDGPDHDKMFFMEVRIGDACYGSGSGKSKKSAEQEAAYNAILRLRKNKNIT